MRNLNAPLLCNGTILRITKLGQDMLGATNLTGVGKGKSVIIPRIPIIPTDLKFQFKRVQFPINLSFSVTINKAQGQTLQVAGVHLEKPCFSRGQLYVACSRVSNARNLNIFVPDGKTYNIVYKNILDYYAAFYLFKLLEFEFIYFCYSEIYFNICYCNSIQ